MSIAETASRISKITDAGHFERLATAVLREANSQYALLTHPGVNAAGKTVKSPVDGITFVYGTSAPHMIAVHHTTCDRDDLEEKWLHDPATVKPRKGSKPTAGPGDLIKTVRLFEAEKKLIPELRGTLILTTNEEPPQSLVRKVHAAALTAGVVVELWSRSALAHFLDFDPKGQWIRRSFLQIEQERLSGELLRELSHRSLDYNTPPGSKGFWIGRKLDEVLVQLTALDVVFVVADSGLGKTVACYKRLAAHVEAGGYGLVLPHDVITEAQSLDQAIEAALRRLHPTLLPGAGSEARALASADVPLLIVIEDINKSGQPTSLLEKLASWSLSGKGGSQLATYQILCPVWPRILASLGDEARKRIDALTISATTFSAKEGAAAVQSRRKKDGLSTTQLEAYSISKLLGHDPLLIALHNPSEEPKPSMVIEQFIASSLARLARTHSEFPATQYRRAIRQLAATMLERRRLDLTPVDIADWFSASPDTTKMLTQITLFGEIMRFAGPASNERIEFRHDRVRDRLLTDAIADLIKHAVMPGSVLADPYFAEVIGASILCPDVPITAVEDVRKANPLALFCALLDSGNADNDTYRAALAAAANWLYEPATHNEDNLNLRWEASRVLSECESPDIVRLAHQFKDPGNWWILHARFRNGDIMAGIELCARYEIGTHIVGYLELIEYVRERHHKALNETLDILLRGNNTSPHLRIGSLRLAGHLSDPALAAAIEASWNDDPHRLKWLADYLWACARCGGNDPAQLLDPICAAWAALPDERPEHTSDTTRHDLAADGIRWAFRDVGLPESVLRYFVEKAKRPELQWPITYMLHSVDHPDAVEFVARELAAMQERAEGTNALIPFTMTAKDEWKRQQEKGRAMSPASRSRLHDLWEDESNVKHLREEAFRLWSSTVLSGDIAILRTVPRSSILGDKALWQRLRRGDREAIPGMIAKLRTDSDAYWWQLGKNIWSDELTEKLDNELVRRCGVVKQEWDSTDGTGNDWVIADILKRLPVSKAESLLLKHWEHLRFSADFVQTALYVATPRLTEAAAAAVAECPDSKSLFAHVTIHFGHKTLGHPGITRRIQVENLTPYLDYLREFDISCLWEVCNDHSWFDLRRQHLDHRLTRDYDRMFTDNDLAMAALDRELAKGQYSWIDHWVDRFLKTGASVDQVMELLRAWLMQHTEIGALELVANAVIHAGRRCHLSVLSGHKIEPRDKIASVIANASFAVMRRSLT